MGRIWYSYVFCRFNPYANLSSIPANSSPSAVSYTHLYERAALLTVKLGLAGVICAIIVGLICAIIQYEKVPVARQIVAVYIELSRNTPLLVQLFFIYYGLPKIGIQTDPQTCGIAGLTFLGGSYMAEAFRSGLETVAAIQTESALSLGMNRCLLYTSMSARK